MDVPRTAIKTTIDAIVGIIIFIALDTLWGDYIIKYSLLSIIIGLALIIFSFKIKMASKKTSRLLGGIITFIGTKPYIIMYVALYPYYFLIGGLLMLFLSNKIVDLVEHNGST